ELPHDDLHRRQGASHGDLIVHVDWVCGTELRRRRHEKSPVAWDEDVSATVGVAYLRAPSLKNSLDSRFRHCDQVYLNIEARFRSELVADLLSRGRNEGPLSIPHRSVLVND